MCPLFVWYCSRVFDIMLGTCRMPRLLEKGHSPGSGVWGCWGLTALFYCLSSVLGPPWGELIHQLVSKSSREEWKRTLTLPIFMGTGSELSRRTVLSSSPYKCLNKAVSLKPFPSVPPNHLEHETLGSASVVSHTVEG